jgi:hypothetical protein
MAAAEAFAGAAHARYFRNCLKLLPSFVSSLDTNRMTLVFFSLSGLDLMDQLPEERAGLVDWIYSLQVRGCGGAGRVDGGALRACRRLLRGAAAIAAVFLAVPFLPTHLVSACIF